MNPKIIDPKIEPTVISAMAPVFSLWEGVGLKVVLGVELEVCASVEAPLEDSVEELDVVVMELYSTLVELEVDKLEVAVVELEENKEEEDVDEAEVDGGIEKVDGTPVAEEESIVCDEGVGVMLVEVEEEKPDFADGDLVHNGVPLIVVQYGLPISSAQQNVS